MGAIKKMIEEEVPGIYVLSLKIGRNIFEVNVKKKTKKPNGCFVFFLHILESEYNNYCVCHSFKALKSRINTI